MRTVHVSGIFPVTSWRRKPLRTPTGACRCSCACSPSTNCSESYGVEFAANLLGWMVFDRVPLKAIREAERR